MQQCRGGWDAWGPWLKGRLAAGEEGLGHCRQLSAKRNPASFPFLSHCSGILRNMHKERLCSWRVHLLLLLILHLKALTTQLVAVTGRMLTVTDEHEEERSATSFGVAQSAGDTSEHRTGFLTARIRGRGWDEGRSHPCSAATVTVRPDLVLVCTSPPSSHSSRLPLLLFKTPKQFSLRHLNKLPHFFWWKLLLNHLFWIWKKSLWFPQTEVPQSWGQDAAQAQSAATSSLGNRDLIVVSARLYCNLPIPTNLIPLCESAAMAPFPTGISGLQWMAFENWRLLGILGTKQSSFLLDMKTHFT